MRLPSSADGENENFGCFYAGNKKLSTENKTYPHGNIKNCPLQKKRILFLWIKTEYRAGYQQFIHSMWIIYKKLIFARKCITFAIMGTGGIYEF